MVDNGTTQNRSNQEQHYLDDALAQFDVLFDDDFVVKTLYHHSLQATSKSAAFRDGRHKAVLGNSAPIIS